MKARSLAFHHASTALVEATPEVAFAYLDDFRAISAHMEKRSPMLMGSTMSIATDELGGRAVGSRVRMTGRVLGWTVSLVEVVTEREPPSRKAWQTVEAKLLVIGDYRLGFEISPKGNHSALRVFIDYALPATWPARWLGRLLSGSYARWCTELMVRDARRHFSRA